MDPSPPALVWPEPFAGKTMLEMWHLPNGWPEHRPKGAPYTFCVLYRHQNREHKEMVRLPDSATETLREFSAQFSNGEHVLRAMGEMLAGKMFKKLFWIGTYELSTRQDPLEIMDLVNA